MEVWDKYGKPGKDTSVEGNTENKALCTVKRDYWNEENPKIYIRQIF